MPSADGRYAPSPTGPLHLGNLRTALVAWLSARAAGASFALRVDDLDPQRSRREHEAGQRADLAALGLDFDGPVVRTSERHAAHEETLARLAADGITFPCWCTRAEIREAAGAPHAHLPEGAYPGTCDRLTAAERAERERSGRPPALRVRAGGARVAFCDAVSGPVEGLVDDFVVRRNDGVVAYNLAVVVDDHALGVGEVVRGADLLAGTPRQRWLHEALGLGAPPRHAHVGLVLAPDGARLAKRTTGERTGAATLADAAARGQDAGAVRGLLAASLGLAEPGERPSPQELVERFDPASRSAEGVVLQLPG